MTSVIVTFSRDGYELYGQKMIKTWLEFWPRDHYRLIAYTEDFAIDDIRVEQRDIHQCCPELVKFKETSSNMIKSTDDGKEIKKIQKTVKWAHKVFAIDHALRNCQDDYLIYLDGDTYTIDHVPPNLAMNLCKENLFAVHFEKLIFGLHFETGLIIFNLKHERMEDFLDVYVDGYIDLSIYDLNKTWDSVWLVHLYEQYEFPVKDLGNKSNRVFNNPAIKKILIHDVGPDKYRNTGFNRYTGRKE